MRIKVLLYHATIRNVFERPIVRQTVSCNEKDPPWMKSLIKKSHFNEKKLLYKCFVKKTGMLNKGGL